MPSTVTFRAPVLKALSIGVEYRELAEQFPEYRLPSVHRDPQIMSGLLQEQFGYRPENITVLTDAKGSNRLPTRENIITAMRELVQDARSGDRLVFHFSGHGSQVLAPPDHVEEIDGFDEVIWPCDIQVYSNSDNFANHILDNDIKKILVDPLPAGVRLTILLDCCRSGTGADLPFSCGAPVLWTPIHPRDINFCQPVPASPPRVAPQRSKSVVDLGYGVGVLDRNPKRRATFQSLDEWSSDGVDPSALPFVTSWAACLDDQDTFGTHLGSVFLCALKESLKQNSQQTNGQMLANITTWVRRALLQQKSEETPPEPQLSSNLSLNYVYHSSFEL